MNLMSYMIEVYYPAPVGSGREVELAAVAAKAGGRLTFHEKPAGHRRGICVTFEFDTLASAEAAADELCTGGVHVEGPSDYGQ